MILWCHQIETQDATLICHHQVEWKENFDNINALADAHHLPTHNWHHLKFQVDEFSAEEFGIKYIGCAHGPVVPQYQEIYFSRHRFQSHFALYFLDENLNVVPFKDDSEMRWALSVFNNLLAIMLKRDEFAEAFETGEDFMNWVSKNVRN